MGVRVYIDSCIISSYSPGLYMYKFMSSREHSDIRPQEKQRKPSELGTNIDKTPISNNVIGRRSETCDQ